MELVLKRFLAASDGSSPGERAVAVAEELADRAGGEYTRVQVEAVATDASASPVRLVLLGSSEHPATRPRGLPGIEIVRLADTWKADLVVLGRQLRPAAEGLTLGRTSDLVIRRRAGPSLFVPPELGAIRCGVIALDGSLRGLGVLNPAAALLNLLGAAGVAVCVLPGGESEADRAAATSDPRAERVRAAVERAPLTAGPPELRVMGGDPVSQVLEVVGAAGAELLVLGVRRGGALGDLGSGHIGRDLLRSAPGAVLTVPI